MLHGLNNQFLYSAYKVVATFADDVGNERIGFDTCFFVLNKEGVMCLVTNRHVLDILYKTNNDAFSGYHLVKIEVSGKGGRSEDNFPEDDLRFSILPNIRFSPDRRNDIACVINPASLEDQHISIDYFIPHSFLATELDFREKLVVCDFLAFPGFPEWYDKREYQPILRTGTISSDPRFDYSYNDLVEGACVAYEAFSYGGSSGSPVFAVQKGPEPGPGIIFPGFRQLLLIGINAGHLKALDQSPSGISYLYKSTAILELINY